MLLENISYTASLLDYIGQETAMTASDVAKDIGETGIARLCHNAAMNKHLPAKQVAHEVEWDYLTSLTAPCPAQWNESFGQELMLAVKMSTADSHEYAHKLFELLTVKQ